MQNPTRFRSGYIYLNRIWCHVFSSEELHNVNIWEKNEPGRFFKPVNKKRDKGSKKKRNKTKQLYSSCVVSFGMQTNHGLSNTISIKAKHVVSLARYEWAKTLPCPRRNAFSNQVNIPEFFFSKIKVYAKENIFTLVKY